MTILDTIFAHKRTEVDAALRELPSVELERRAAQTPAAPDFIAALHHHVDRNSPRLIAEIKQRSPSKGMLRPCFDPLRLARDYAAHGAAAISVLTDERFFGGSLDHLKAIATLDLSLPLLRKDFIFHPYQLLQARAAGASAALLIVAMLEEAQLADLIAAGQELTLTSLVEVHTLRELDAALKADATLIGINNRNLHTFETTLDITTALIPHIPDTVTVVSESGIRTAADVKRLAELGADAILVGEGLITAPDTAARVREFSKVDVQL